MKKTHLTHAVELTPVVQEVQPDPPAPPPPPVFQSPPPPPAPKLSETDKLALDLAKAQKQTAIAEAQTATAKAENAQLNYRYTILQLYYKYQLKETDAINEQDGSIILGGAQQQ